MSERPRHCAGCGVEIYACNGCVLARDMLAVMEGALDIRQVREVCGKCALRQGMVSEADRVAWIDALPSPATWWMGQPTPPREEPR